MESWTDILSWSKCHWPDLKSAGLLRRNLFLNSLKISTLYSLLTVCPVGTQWMWIMPVLSKKGSSKVCGWICSVWPSWVWESQHASNGNSVSWSLSHSSRSSFHLRSSEHQKQRDMNWSARPSPCCHKNVCLSDLLWAPFGQTLHKSSVSLVPSE